MPTHSMPSADAAWLHMDRPTNLMVINSVLWFDEPVDLARLIAVFHRRIALRFPRFTQLAEEGALGAHWVDDPNFDIHLHFHHIALPAPHDQAALQELVGDLITKPLDRGRPLWDVYLIDDYGGGSAVLTRMHHCIADGIALARVMLLLTDPEPEPAAVGVADPVRHPHLELARGLAHTAVDVVRHPLGATADLATLVKLLFPRPDGDTPLKGDLGVLESVAWTRPISLRRVKTAGRAHGATVNDVLASVVTGALGRYLRERGDGTADHVNALIPFNLRPLEEPLPRDLGNRFGLVLLGLPIGIDDPLERLLEVKARMDAIKSSHEGAMAYAILALMGRTPVQLEERLIDFFTDQGSLVLTNVPGPAAPIYVAGKRVRGVLVWAPTSGSLGMSVSIFSYDGKVTAGFLTDAGIVPDPNELAEAFHAEFEALYSARHHDTEVTR